MKKFFPLCLLLIVALVWTVSVASSFDRTPTASSDEKVFIEKPKTTVERPVVQKQVQKTIVRDVPRRTESIDLDRVPTATAGEAARVAGEKAGEITVVPIEMGQRSASAMRMKYIKADGVISPDEKTEYEELLSLAPAGELPMPLNIVSEVEPNNTCDSAQLIACGDTVWCADLGISGDTDDYYTFTLDASNPNWVVTIETHDPGTSCQYPGIGDTKLWLYNSDCTVQIAYNDDIGYPNYYSRIVQTLPPGTYAARVTPYSISYSGSYHLSLICELPPPIWACWENPPDTVAPDGKTAGGNGDIEPNDLCSEASRALCEYAYCGVIADTFDVDWYYVDIPPDTSYSLHIRVFGDDTPNQYAEGLGLDPRIELWAPGCTTMVAMNEDYYGTFPDAENYDSQIDPTGYPNCFPPGSRAYIAIYTYYAWASPGPYLLIINCEPCEIPQQGCDQDSLTIEITLDSYPGEVTWDVVDQNTSQVVCSGGPYVGSPGTVITEVCCLDSTGCYDFNIYDAWGDGAGPYNLYFNGVLFYSSTGAYGYGESVMYIGNGCPEPTGACCVSINCVATVSLDSCDALGGDWYIDEDCDTFTCPYGACCLHDGQCTATTTLPECNALDGTWYEFETCPEYDCPVATSCDTAIYHNGDPVGGARSSQCALDYGFTTETADDFVLPGAGTKYISEVVAWFWFWNGPSNANPAFYDAINVTFYANDNITFPFPAPGGQPLEPPDSLCSHIENIPNGIIYATSVPAGSFTWVNDGHPQYRLMIPVDVGLTAGDTIWLGVEPVMPFFAGGQTGWVPTDSVKYNGLVQGFPLVSPPLPYWTPEDPPKDVAFCLIEAPPPIWSCFDDPPLMVPPDNKQPGGIGDIEPNDVCSLAVEALCEYAYCGIIDTTTDDDWYYVDLPADNTYGVHVRVFANDTPNQYAQGGGLDPRVFMLRADCQTLVASNDDYFGTFPDAENYDSQLDPGGANCFQPGERVYIRVDRASGPGGPYLLIINCVPCEMPTGACCVGGECVATNFQHECEALGGYWYAGETCPDFECPPDCFNAIYTNGEPKWPNSYASQCLTDYAGGVSAEVADDFVLPGAGTVNINMVIAWFGHWNPVGTDPSWYSGINITVYANDIITNPYPAPGGKPAAIGDPLCTHSALIPGGIVFDTLLLPGEYSWIEDLPGSFRLMMPVDVTLNSGETYWLGVEPHMPFAAGGQCGWNNVPAPDTTGNSARQIFEAAGLSPWTPLSVDMAFCLLAAGCDYVVGDVNGSNSHNGLDVTYGVNYFKGGLDPVCPDCPPCAGWFYCGDVNGSCSYNGLDITYNVNYFKGVGPDPVACDDCPPVGGSPARDNSKPETPSVIKTKPVFEQKPGTK